MKGEGGAFRMKEQHKKVFCGNNELGVYEKVKKKRRCVGTVKAGRRELRVQLDRG